jgi:hypothetical protein
VSPRAAGVAIALAAMFLVHGCMPLAEGEVTPGTEGPFAVGNAAQTIIDPRVWYDPYGGVDWDRALRLKAQTHDHTGLRPARLLSYDSAGYAFIPIMEYSGVASLPYAQRDRLWPADSVLPDSVRTLAPSATWVPSAEEVGYQHVTSLFLTRFIEKWEPGQHAERQAWMYGGTQQAIDLVARMGGFPILAHPWGAFSQFSNLDRFRGVEIYSAYAERLFETKDVPYFATTNRNAEILAFWDRMLLQGRFIVGVAVNDHYGPYRPLAQVSRRVRDSGKILVLTPDRTLDAYRTAMEEGALFAITDFGDTKDQVPRFDSLTVTGTIIRAWSATAVTWIADGVVLPTSATWVNVSALPPATRFVRAELRGTDGSVVYSQPFLLRPRGDVDGDFRVNQQDAQLCARLTPGMPNARTLIAACNARARAGSS